MNYLASKDEILKHDKQNGADEDALDVLGRVPDRQCDVPNEVSHEVSGAQ